MTQYTAPTIDEAIDNRIGEVRTEALDLSFGELLNLYSNRELVIQPEYQRLFRWSEEQRSRLVESILLELPIPPIFMVENADGVLELIDGLQRISSIFQFLESSVLGLEPLELYGCDLIPDLNGKTFSGLPLRLKLRIRRSSVRAIVIKRQSSGFLRYEMFRRLNTGGSSLAGQEIRTCSALMVGDPGVRFIRYLRERADFPEFQACTEPLSQADRDQRGDEELVLRFFATKNFWGRFRGSVRDWLDDVMKSIILERSVFDYENETITFESLFSYLNRVFGPGAFVSYRGESPIGALAPAHFEAVSVGVLNVLPALAHVSEDVVRQSIIRAVQTPAFRDFTGPGANSKQKLQGRILHIQETLTAIL
jgi:hypothetical protein